VPRSWTTSGLPRPSGDDGCPEPLFLENATEVNIPDATKDQDGNTVPGDWKSSSVILDPVRTLNFIEVRTKFEHGEFNDLNVDLEVEGEDIFDIKEIGLYSNISGQAHLDHTVRIESFFGESAKKLRVWVRDEDPGGTGKLIYWSVTIW